MMVRNVVWGTVIALSLAVAAPFADEVVVNAGTAQWTRGPRDPAGSENIVLRDDDPSNGLELFVRYPGGHVFAPHSHDSNERIVMIEGRLQIGEGSDAKALDPGGYAFLPAKQVQRMKCASSGRCAFYVAWDGNPASRAAR